MSDRARQFNLYRGRLPNGMCEIVAIALEGTGRPGDFFCPGTKEVTYVGHLLIAGDNERLPVCLAGRELLALSPVPQRPREPQVPRFLAARTCPKCGSRETDEGNSRHFGDEERRSFRCKKCGACWYQWERVEQSPYRIDYEGREYDLPGQPQDQERGEGQRLLEAMRQIAHQARAGLGTLDENGTAVGAEDFEEIHRIAVAAIGGTNVTKEASVAKPARERQALHITGTHWKHENDCVLNDPVTGKPVRGARIYSDSGFRVAEIYYASPEDLAAMIAAPRLRTALGETAEFIGSLLNQSADEVEDLLTNEGEEVEGRALAVIAGAAPRKEAYQ